MNRIRSGAINDLKTITAGYWLIANRARYHDALELARDSRVMRIQYDCAPDCASAENYLGIALHYLCSILSLPRDAFPGSRRDKR